MVVFNPEVQTTNDPNWLNVSRPISDMKGDMSGAALISGAADLLTSGVKAADTLTKQSIDTDVYAGADKLRDAYTDSLKAIRNSQIAATDPANSTLLPNDGATPPPAGLENGLERVKQIGTALAQNGGGKINDTLYTGALNSLSKQLRNSYPGYRDYIDEKIKSVTGTDPANAFMRNLMEDINKNVEEGKTERNATRSLGRKLVEEGFHDVNGVSAAQMLEGYDKGIFTTDQFNKWVNSSKKLEYDLKQKAAARNDRQADDADAAKVTAKDLSTATGQIVDHAWTTMTIGKGTDTPAKLFDYIQKNAGNPNVTDERSQAIGQQLGAMRTAMFNQAWAEATKGGSNSMIAKMGGDGEAAKKVIEGRLATLDLAIKSVYDNQWGAAYSHMNMNKAIANDSTNLMYNAPAEEVRKYNRMVGAVNQISPQAASQFFKTSLLGDVPQQEKEFLKSVKLELLTQPDEQMGSLTSANGQLQKMKAKGASSPKTYSDFVDTVNLITDKEWSMENRINLARGFFDPEKNAGLLADKNFKKDQTVNGRFIPGKYSVFSKLSSPDVAKSIAEIGAARPDISKDYDVMMTREFGEQLFSRELKDLGQENADTTVSRGYKIAYVSDKGQVPRFEIVGLDNRPMTDGQALAVRAPVSAKNRLNSGISGLYTVYANTGHGDPSTSVLNTMYKYGYQEASSANISPGSGSREIGDVPKMIYNSLIGAQQERLRKAGEAMQKAKEKQ